MPRNPFEQTKADTELDTGKQAKAATRLTISEHEAGKHRPANGKGAQHPDRAPVGQDAEY